jgi:cyclohexanone monooxygenase
MTAILDEAPGRELDVVVAGAGFAGLYALHRLRGQGLAVRVFEAGEGVGGTWYWNRYPGARCDVESMFYSFSFDDALQQEWHWTERYATQPEILRYAEHVADRYDLRPDIQLETRVEAAHFDEASGRWRIRTLGPTGAQDWVARFFISAVGCLSSSNVPDFPGLEDFEGERYHTGRWPKTAPDLAGKRVGIIGTGSSGIQAIPQLARQAEHLSVFQRTANYSVPANNHPLDPDREAEIKADYPRFRAMGNGFGPVLEPSGRSVATSTPEEVRVELEARWERGGLGFLSSFEDLLVTPESNEVVAGFVREKIREIVDDPEVAETLCPDTVYGCKRPCIDTGYYETFNRPDVTLVDVSDKPIERITPGGLVVDGREHPLDVLVFATGFDAMTGSIHKIDIRGRGGRSLEEKWAAGPRTYLGLQSEGFPNLFLVTGPGSPSVLSNMLNAIEQHVDFIARCLAAMEARGAVLVEPELEAEDAWVAHTNEIASYTLYWSCSSWYLGDNIPGKPRVFMPYVGIPAYNEKCEDVIAKGYEGFAFH